MCVFNQINIFPHTDCLPFVCLPVGASPVFQQQDHLWPGGGEVQRHHLHPGEESRGHAVLCNLFLNNLFDLVLKCIFGHGKKKKTSEMLWSDLRPRGFFKVLADWRPLLCTAGWGVSETGRRQWHHLPGEAGDHRRRTRALCHVSLPPVTLRSIISAGRARGLVCSSSEGASSVFACSHKLADAKTRKLMGRDEFRLIHYAGDVNYNVNGACACVRVRACFFCVEWPLTPCYDEDICLVHLNFVIELFGDGFSWVRDWDED